MATRASDTGPTDIVGRKALRQPVVQAVQFVETSEHLGVAGRISAASGDDVTAVPPVLTCRAEEFLFLGQRRADGILQVGGGITGQFASPVAEGDDDRLVVALDGYGVLIAGEELDQERGYSVSYQLVLWLGVKSCRLSQD
ncbi:hypothetical protein C440_13764 [Haloferax mucosum ATCC BAA-1512]|uniref:Uncharacterized protein n=1 Tax=Haloferax mucosum ATCC BAA-1512 TaxID=662479 RepID=M0I3L0_9EURY|nr:hypothetical protein C440_13764 [Haloferax mucosum ATCC BAA-1512]